MNEVETRRRHEARRRRAFLVVWHSLVLALASTIAGCSATSPSSRSAMSRDNPSGFEPALPLPSSHAVEYANPSRNSRVDVAPRGSYELRRAADTTAVPQTIVISPSGEHVAIVYSSHLDALTNGVLARRVAYLPDGGRHLVVARDDGFRSGKFDHGWDGADRGVQHISAVTARAYEIAALVTPSGEVSLAQNFDTLSTPLVFSVQAQHGERHADGTSRWAASVKDHGTGAILADGRVAVASQKGSLSLLTAAGNHESGDGVPLFKLETGLRIYQLSFTEAGLVALFAEGGASHEPSSVLPPPFQPIEGAWTTGVVCFDSKGNERWRTSLPFAARHPAVDGTGGRVILAGNGLAALENGRIEWQSTFETLAMATAFSDGTLAVALGPDLRVIDAAGKVVARLRVPESPRGAGSGATAPAADPPSPPPFVTPPAIGPDGAIWIATARHLYVAR